MRQSSRRAVSDFCDVYVSTERNDADKQLTIWKEYARDYADKSLGAFKEAYTTDSWGDRKETFADLAAAVCFPWAAIPGSRQTAAGWPTQGFPSALSKIFVSAENAIPP